MLKITANMMMAGIDASAHFTISTTMEKNGISKSTTITLLASSSLILTPVLLIWPSIAAAKLIGIEVAIGDAKSR